MWRYGYGVRAIEGNLVGCEPTKEDIQQAIKDGRLETRPYSGNAEKLDEEWRRNAKNNDEIVANARRYHAERAAWFAVNRSWGPIKLKKGVTEIDDGSHRYLAAWALEEATIDVAVNGDPA
jgi:hypothetical protein